ncbi:response regulator [Cohnella sp. CFH 77786]|uniref:response regulator transcription factor n=1 Tax=Cohnella sp. CFH 77786 TaxID=2662265 RepID=UPI001C60CAB2|nr:response regulator transcription factor [Cohnella sp. CFH 77786]MBW5448119.1 response regulator [Cohnella sp. CFH 77786]
MTQTKGIKVLLVDDEPNILQFLEMGLVNEGYQVGCARNGAEGLELFRTFSPHIVILDVMMPELDGYEVCRRMKRQQPVAVIMLTAKEEPEDRVRGLTIGADDYMPKPFSFEELLARIHARLRNQFPNLLEEIHAGPFCIDDKRKEIRLRDEPLDLSPTEYGLLKLLVLENGSVLSKSAILDRVWGYDFGGEENIVEVYVRALREKIGDREHQTIRTIRGAGYRMDLA